MHSKDPHCRHYGKYVLWIKVACHEPQILQKEYVSDAIWQNAIYEILQVFAQDAIGASTDSE